MIDERKVMLAIKDGIWQGLVETQVLMARVTRSMLSQPGTGRIYRIGAGKRGGRNLREIGFHRASAPGRPPAPDRNRLRGSWSIGTRKTAFGLQPISQEEGFVRPRMKPRRLGFEYGSNVKYAAFLEFGTRWMKRRPYISPVMKKIEPRVLPIVSRAVQTTLKGTR
jgi:hypothetical protein